MVENLLVNEVENSSIELEQSESLIARRVFLGNRILEPCQRNNLFKTSCHFGGKVYNVIVDGGSIDNLVAEELV